MRKNVTGKNEILSFLLKKYLCLILQVEQIIRGQIPLTTPMFGDLLVAIFFHSTEQDGQQKQAKWQQLLKLNEWLPTLEEQGIRLPLKWGEEIR